MFKDENQHQQDDQLGASVFNIRGADKARGQLLEGVVNGDGVSHSLETPMERKERQEEERAAKLRMKTGQVFAAIGEDIRTGNPVGLLTPPHSVHICPSVIASAKIETMIDEFKNDDFSDIIGLKTQKGPDNYVELSSADYVSTPQNQTKADVMERLTGLKQVSIVEGEAPENTPDNYVEITPQLEQPTFYFNAAAQSHDTVNMFLNPGLPENPAPMPQPGV